MREEIELIWTIDRSEVHHHTYELRRGQLVPVPHYFEVPGWRSDAAAKETPGLLDCFDRGGTFVGVFDAGTLIGVSVLERARVGQRGDQVQLAYLYVSRTYRGRGVGIQLFEEAVSSAQQAGAKALYVSATPTVNTVDFYLNRGCVLAPEPDPALLAAEPDDIHLVYLLTPPDAVVERAFGCGRAGSDGDSAPPQS
jgi:predicted N-acetyltransferase YhbS